jgi:hypothetical protein
MAPTGTHSGSAVLTECGASCCELRGAGAFDGAAEVNSDAINSARSRTVSKVTGG